MMKKLYRILLVILAFIMVLSSVSCKGEQSVADDISEPRVTATAIPEIDISEPVPGGVLKLATLKYNSLNPLTTDSEDIKQYMQLVYSDFISLDYSGKPIGEIAESWESSDDCTSWVFKIKKNISWHDEGVLDAEDVVATINHIKTKGGLYVENVKLIKSFEATDPYTLSVVCSEPCSVLPCMMTFPVLKKESLNTVGSMPVGTGMYSYNYAESSAEKIVLSKFGSYYGNKPYIDSVEITVCKSEAEKYESDVGFSMLYDGVIKSSYIKENVYKHEFPGNLLTLFYFNLNGSGNHAAVKDVNVRNAINSYIDRKTLINAGAAGNAEPAVLPVLKGNFLLGGDGASSESSDMLGDKFMRDSGYEKNEAGIWAKDGVSVDIVCVVPNDDTEFLLLAERFERDLESKGISVTLNFCNSNEYAAAIKNGTYSIVMAQISLAEWIDFESVFKTGAKLNINSFSNPDIDLLIKNLMMSSDYKDMSEIYGDMVELLVTQLPVCGIYVNRQTVIMDNSLKGVTENGLYFWDIFHSFDKWYIE